MCSQWLTKSQAIFPGHPTPWSPALSCHDPLHKASCCLCAAPSAQDAVPLDMNMASSPVKLHLLRKATGCSTEHSEALSSFPGPPCPAVLNAGTKSPSAIWAWSLFSQLGDVGEVWVLATESPAAGVRQGAAECVGTGNKHTFPVVNIHSCWA